MRQFDRRAAALDQMREIADTTVRPTATWVGDTERPVESAAVREARVRDEAYRLWEEAGRPQGDGVEFWLKAEHALGPREGEWDGPV
jgi:hypothetical protein